nr:MAG TPA: hypothetical protein [Caudoviricetes sp.]
MKINNIEVRDIILTIYKLQKDFEKELINMGLDSFYVESLKSPLGNSITHHSTMFLLENMTLTVNNRESIVEWKLPCLLNLLGTNSVLEGDSGSIRLEYLKNFEAHKEAKSYIEELLEEEKRNFRAIKEMYESSEEKINELVKILNKINANN